MFNYPKPSKEDSDIDPLNDPLRSPFGTPFGDEASDFSMPTRESVTPEYEAPSSNLAKASRNILNADVCVKGLLRFSDELLIDGEVTGRILSDGVLTIGANAVIVAGKDGDNTAIRTKSAIIHGKVSGDVEVTDLVELAATAELVGNVKAARLSIQTGAVFIGASAVGVPSSSQAAAPKAAPATAAPLAAMLPSDPEPIKEEPVVSPSKTSPAKEEAAEERDALEDLLS